MHLKIKLFIIFVLTTIIISPAHAIEDSHDADITAQKKKIFTIDECVDYALKNDPNIKVAKNMVKVYKSRVGQAKSDYFPKLGGGTGYNFLTEKASGSSSRNSNYYDLDLSVNQLIWNFGKTTANINMQKYNYQSAQYDLDFEILKTTYKVKTAYYSVLAAKAFNDVSNKTVRINKLNYERTKALFEEGLKSKIDVVNSEVYYTDAQIQLLETQNAYESALIELANAMYYTDKLDFTVESTENFNFKPADYTPHEINVNYTAKAAQDSDSELILTSGIEKHNMLQDFKFSPYQIEINDALEEAYKNRPDLKSLELVLKASNESLKSIKRSYYPEIGASAGYGYRRMENTNTNSFRVSAGLDFPIINIMDIKYRIDEGKSYYEIAEENVDLSKKNIYFEVQNFYVDMKQLEKRIPLMAKKVDQTLENFELADGRYTVGLGNFIELQDAQTNYNNAQLEFIQSIFKYNVAREQFLKSMGVK